ncbi:MAG: septal ring lytic transglycosylase RlpA family protein [Rhodospirillales bacterium]|jgi:rare lipoprotein A|nr:septal ring lytic transglycosylase RlpA family protein [Rhodospirillales bacterium]
MLSLRRFLPPLVLLLVAVVMAGCATAPRPSATAQSGKAGYKVGNPYQIDGVWYYPAEDWNYDETGIASWYGEQFHGRYTANGEVFDLNSVTAAHRTLPMPTVAQVTNLENGRSIQIRINDRGPYARGRIIDLSRRSAQLLGFEGKGTAKVRVKILVPETIQAVSLARRGGGDDKLTAATETPRSAPVVAVTSAALAPPPGATAAPLPPVSSASRPFVAPQAPQVASAAPLAPPPEKVSQVAVRATQIYIQAGAFTRSDNAQRAKSRLDPLGTVRITGVRSQGIELFRVRLGPIQTVDEADRLLGRVVDSGLTDARIVVD